MSDGKINHRVTKLERAVADLQKSQLETVSSPREHNPESVGDQSDSSQERTSAPPAPPIVNNPKANRPDAKSRAKNAKPWRVWLVEKVIRRWVRWLQVLGIIAGIAYALVTYFQWRDLRKNFRDTERAWLKIEPAWPTSPDGSVVLTVSNLGKSVAFRTQVNVWVEAVDQFSLPPLDEKGMHGGAEWGLIFPGDKQRLPAERNRPDGSGFWPFTESEKADVISGKMYVVAYGIATYNDAFGYHWTRYCSWKSYGNKDSAAEPCVAYEAVGDNYVPNPKQ